MPADRPYRPTLRTRRPVVQGPHTAVVIGPDNEAVHTDALGRVQVVMHWDREWFLRGEQPSCWLRVAQAWGGVGHGALFTPRVGSEVIVSFLDGDPDRPVCTGCVYNGEAAPPQALPQHKTRSTIRTASVGGHEGFNELTFEDEGGREEIYLHAQRNLREAVGAQHRTSVGADQSLTVGRDRTKTVRGSERAVVEGDRDDEVHGNVTEVIAGSRDVTIMGTQLNGTVHGGRLKVSGTYAIESDTCIRLQCGASSLELTPAGVRIYAPMVQVHGGPSSAHLLPTGVQVQGPQATVVGGQSLLQLAVGAELQGGAEAVVRQGESQLRLDGNATVLGATASVHGTMVAELSGTTTSVEGQTVGVSGEALQVSGASTTVVEGGGARATFAGGMIDMG
jgi:type VI secretion system secreted protein VgrG